MPDFLISSLRGGLNEAAPTSISDDQCTTATNIELWASMLGERRLGCDAIDPTGWPFAGYERVVWMHRHLPTSDPSAAELWVLAIDDTGPTALLAYKDTTWHTVVMGDALIIDGVSEYLVQGQTLHEKLFIAYKSAVDRLHVWDGTTFRRVGIAEPSAAPTGANSGVGTFTGTRYYRVRFVRQTAGITDLRSEPSATLTHAPSGTGSGVTVTRPTTVGADAAVTHWELEASVDNANFYRIATTAIASTTAIDTAAYGTYASTTGFVLSEDIGDYELIPSVKFLTVDQDRLIGGSSHMDDTLAARMIWTPVFKDPGVGNDERIPTDTDNILDLDVSEGGPLTGISATINGYVFVTKFQHIYQMTRQGVRTRAYEAVPLTKQRGAIPGSIVEALDQAGNPSLFCLDPDIGPSRIGPRGFEPCGADIFRTWDTINLDATKVMSRGIYFPEKKQVIWNIATNASNVPNLGIVLHTHEMRETPDGMRRGWVIWNGLRTQSLAMCLFSDNIDAGTARSNVLKPFIGAEGNGLILMTDTTNQDNGTDYQALIKSKPFVHGSLLHTFEVQRGNVLAKALTGATLDVRLIANFEEFSKEVTGVDLTPASTEERVMKTLDDLGLSELRTLQVEFSDTTTPSNKQWVLEQFAILEDQWQRA